MNWYDDLSIRWKVGLAPAVALLCLVVVSTVSLLGNASLLGAFQTVTAHHVPRLLQVKELDSQLKDLQRSLMQTLAWEAAGQQARLIEELDKRINRDLKSFQQRLADEVARTDLEPAQAEALQALVKHYKVYQDTAGETLDLKGSGVATAASFVFTLDAAFSESVKALDSLQIFEIEAMKAAEDAAMARGDRNTTIVVVVGLAALVLAAGLGWVIQRGITRVMNQAAHAANAVAQGNLRDPVPRGAADETGQVLTAMATMRDNLAQLIGQVRSAADSIATASSEIATGNTDLSARTEQQASALQQTTASMHQMTHSVSHNAETAQRANELAGAAAAVADQGGVMVGRVVETMASISAGSRRIADIVGVIDGIAFQTNILALNAAVEAARAGEQGRGFAVVAGEVRALAQRSATAAKEIKGLISESVTAVESGRSLVEDAGTTMNRIVEQVRSVTTLIAEIHTATAEQTQSIAQVNDAMLSLDQGTQQNAALVEESAAAAESLRHQSADLMHHIARFQI